MLAGRMHGFAKQGQRLIRARGHEQQAIPIRPIINLKP